MLHHSWFLICACIYEVTRRRRIAYAGARRALSPTPQLSFQQQSFHQTSFHQAQPPHEVIYLQPAGTFMVPSPTSTPRASAPYLEPVPSAFEWDFFLSHVQAEGGQSMRLLQARLQARGIKCWLDQSEIPSGPNIKRDVPRSRVLLVYLTKSIFTRPWCLFEMLCALRARRPIMLLIEKQGAGATDIWPLLESMPRAPDSERPLLKPLIDQCVALKATFHEVDAYLDAMINEVAGCLRPESQRAAVVDLSQADLNALEGHIQCMLYP